MRCHQGRAVQVLRLMCLNLLQLLQVL